VSRLKSGQRVIVDGKTRGVVVWTNDVEVHVVPDGNHPSDVLIRSHGRVEDEKLWDSASVSSILASWSKL
jgi:hypothetical protein